MRRVILAVLLSVFLAAPGNVAASCWECVADECSELRFWMFGYPQFGKSNCSQIERCFPNGSCFTDCWAYGSICTYWDVWF